MIFFIALVTDVGIQTYGNKNSQQNSFAVRTKQTNVTQWTKSTQKTAPTIKMIIVTLIEEDSHSRHREKNTT